MAKVVCEKCDSSFKLEVVKDMKNCPVCGADFECGDDSHNEPAEEDFENPDLYFYDIEEPDEYGDDLRDVWCQCTSCRKVNRIPYSSFDYIDNDCLKLHKGVDLSCKGCNKQFKNRIVPRRPDGWRELNLWERELDNVPKCPICGSTSINKISMTNKAASTIAFGIFAVGHVSKTYKCSNCKSKF